MGKQTRMERNMGSHAFDTLKAAKRLGAAGFDLDQSESLAGIIGESFTDKLATKDDLRNLEMRLTGKIEVLDIKIDSVNEERLTGKIEKQGIEVGMQIATIKAEIAEAQVSLHRDDWSGGHAGPWLHRIIVRG